MNKKQIAKFKNSHEFENLCLLAYPYGLDESDDAQWEKIMIVEEFESKLRAKWKHIYENHAPAEHDFPEGWDAAINALDNSDYTARVEKVYAPESAEYYRCAISAYEGSEFHKPELLK